MEEFKLADSFAVRALALCWLVLVWAGCHQAPAPSSSKLAPPIDFDATKIKAEQGDATAQNALGDLYAHGQGVTQDYAQAARWYRLSAEQGLAAAQVNL